MKIGIMGTGRMGRGLGRLWADRGYPVMLGSRDLGRAAALAEAMGPNASGGSNQAALAFGDVILLAVPWDTVEALVRSMDGWSGKIVIDCVNALDGAGGASLPGGLSVAEHIATWAAGARVVKAFNGIYFSLLEQPGFSGQAASVFYAGDDAGAKAAVGELIGAIGFAPVDCGPLVAARHLEWLAALWIHLAFRQGWPPDFAFTVLRR
jgi:predicted dinucleotide-binding enzyme